MNVGITCYILAYIVGGYAKAKEGIEDTIEEKELNVEMLMLFALLVQLLATGQKGLS